MRLYNHLFNPITLTISVLGSTLVSVSEPKRIEMKTSTQPQSATTIDLSHSSSRGTRLTGWEDVNIVKLSKVLGRTSQHVRDILVGRKDTRLRFLDEVANILNIPMAELVERIRKAKALDEQRMVNQVSVLRAKLKSRMMAAARTKRNKAQRNKSSN